MKSTLLRFIYILLLVGLLSVAASSCDGVKRERHHDGAVWNTTFHITYIGGDDLSDSVSSILADVEKSLSMFDKTSLVSRVNASPSGTVTADTLLKRIIGVSRRINLISGGAFDPTVAPLVDIWGFGTSGPLPEPPSSSRLDSVLALVGMADCYVDPTDGRVVKKHDATRFDFSAIAKGMACDLIGEMFTRNGCDDYMVEIGGEVFTRGLNPRRHPWRIMIDAPVESDSLEIHECMAVIEPGDAGVATSGNYRNYRDTDNGRIGHTINPLSGIPARSSMLSATVVAPSCMIADAMATACMAMEPLTAAAMMDGQHGIGAMLVWRAQDGTMTTKVVGDFPRILTKM